MKKIDIGDFCSTLESALNALEILIFKTDEVSGDVDLTEFNTLAFARDATLQRTKLLLSEFSAANENNIE